MTIATDLQPVRRPATPKAAVLALHDNGLTFAQIARALKCSRTYVSMIAQAEGLKSHHVDPTPDWHKAHPALRKALDGQPKGLTIADLARRTGYGRSTIIRAFQGKPVSMFVFFDLLEALGYTFETKRIVRRRDP